MALLIKYIHDLVDLAIDNGISNYWTRAQIDGAVDAGQMTLFRQILKEYPKTKYVRNELDPFKVIASVTVTGSIGLLPTGASGFEHEVEAYATVSSVKIPVKFVEPGFFRKRVLDPVDPPSSTKIFAQIYYDSAKKVELSSQVTPLVLTYFKRPTYPVYGTTGSQNAYDETTSTDVLWSQTMRDILVEKTLPYLGLGMKDGVLIRATQNQIPKDISAI